MRKQRRDRVLDPRAQPVRVVCSFGPFGDRRLAILPEKVVEIGIGVDDRQRTGVGIEGELVSFGAELPTSLPTKRAISEAPCDR